VDTLAKSPEHAPSDGDGGKRVGYLLTAQSSVIGGLKFG
jgi:hypothetical protein